MSIDKQNTEVRAALKLLEAQLENQRKEMGIPGLSVAVVSDQDTIWARGFGFADMEKNVRATPRTTYRVASITKVFTATMLMMLRDSGQLELDHPISRYLPELSIHSPFPDSLPVTFRQVISHMAGFPREAPFDRWQMEESPPIDLVLESLEGAEMVYAPMSKYKYSNLGIALLGAAIERAAGQPYAEHVRQKILLPLGMRESGFSPTGEVGRRLAVGYLALGGKPRTRARPRPDGGAFVPVGQLISSVEDMSRFIAFQFGDGTVGGMRILAASTLREMHAPVFMDPDWKGGITIGWLLRRVCGRAAIGFDGGNPGYSTDITLVPELKLGVATFANTNTDPVAISHSILELLVPIFRRVQRKTAGPASEKLQRELARFVGRYRGNLGVEMLLEISGGLLRADIPGYPTEESEVVFEPIGECTFRMVGGPQDGERVVFDVGVDGKVQAMRGLMVYYQSELRRE